MKTIQLKPETKSIFADYPELKQIWEDNIEPPTVASRTPHEVCYYMGNTFIPVYRIVDGVLVEHNKPEEGPYTLLTVCDDVPVSLSVGEQAIFDYSDAVDLPDLSMAQQEAALAEAEAQLEQLLGQS